MCCSLLARFEPVEAVEQFFIFLTQGLEVIAQLLHLVGLFACAADRFDDFCDTALHASVQVTGAQAF